jgi:hypothetical protein
MARFSRVKDSKHSRPWWSRLIRMVVPLSLLWGIALLAGCGGWTVAPPPPPVEPSTVYLSQYGMHSRVAVQVDPTRMMEYGYGDWRYYAEGEKGPWRGIVAIATPTPAALGKRSLPLTLDHEEFRRQAGAERSVRFAVEKARAVELVRHLEGRYQAKADTEIQPVDSPFRFVKDDLPYQLSHNSNHQAADWLRRLGCEVHGNPVSANFRVIERRK